VTSLRFDVIRQVF